MASKNVWIYFLIKIGKFCSPAKMIDLCKIKEDFSLMVKDTQPWTLTQFVMWLDLKLSEFKIKGYMVLDHNIKTKPKWLADEDKTSDVAPTPAPCRHCNHSSSQNERQFYSDIHSSPSSLQQRTVTKTVEEVEDDSNIRGKVGIIDLSHGISDKGSGRSDNIQIQSYRQISSQDYHMGESDRSTNMSKDRDKRARPDIIELDGPSPPEKMFIPAPKANQKTSTPISAAHLMQKMKNRLPLSKGSTVYTSTSSTTTPTFSTSYTSPTARGAPSNLQQRKYALGAPPVTCTSFSTSSTMSDYQNLENLIAQTVQYNESLSQNQQTGKGDQRGGFHGQRQSQDYGPSQSTFMQTPSTQSSFMNVNVDQQMTQTFTDNRPLVNISNNDQNTFVPSSEAVPVALHANMDVINRDNSISSAISASEITEIKIESDNEDTNINESFLSESSTSQTSAMTSNISNMSDTSLPIQSQSQEFYSGEPGTQPKPGLVDPDTAKAYNMVELVTGSGVYVYDKNIAQAFKVGTEKETGTYSGEKMARYLLNVFWSRKELVGATLSKAGRGKKILNQQIIEAILGFCHRNSRHGLPAIKAVLHHKISATTFREKKKILHFKNIMDPKCSK